jgi:hypothetical protein
MRDLHYAKKDEIKALKRQRLKLYEDENWWKGDVSC